MLCDTKPYSYSTDSSTKMVHSQVTSAYMKRYIDVTILRRWLYLTIGRAEDEKNGWTIRVSNQSPVPASRYRYH